MELTVVDHIDAPSLQQLRHPISHGYHIIVLRQSSEGRGFRIPFPGGPGKTLGGVGMEDQYCGFWAGEIPVQGFFHQGSRIVCPLRPQDFHLFRLGGGEDRRFHRSRFLRRFRGWRGLVKDRDEPSRIP